MENTYEIRLIDPNEMEVILPFIQLLNPRLELNSLNERLKEMLENGYECVGVYDSNKLIGIAGLWTLTKFYIGKHIEPDNVIILPAYRGKGIGKQLFEWINRYAEKKGCVALELNCYVDNSDAHKFWMSEGYKILGFHFQKKLHAV